MHALTGLPVRVVVFIFLIGADIGEVNIDVFREKRVKLLDVVSEQIVCVSVSRSI